MEEAASWGRIFLVSRSTFGAGSLDGLAGLRLPAGGCLPNALM